MAYLYIVRCTDGSLYTGIAADIRHRMKVHTEGGKTAAKYTRSHPVKELVGLWRFADLATAARFEWRIKQLPREKKQMLLLAPERIGEAPYAPEEGIAFEVLCGVTLEDCLAGRVSPEK